MILMLLTALAKSFILTSKIRISLLNSLGANSINLAATLLYGTPLFIRHLESAYSTMYDRYQQGLDPEHIYVEHV